MNGIMDILPSRGLLPSLPTATDIPEHSPWEMADTEWTKTWNKGRQKQKILTKVLRLW